MINLTQGGYTHNEVLGMLEKDRTIDFIYRTFNKSGIYLGDLECAEATITFNSEAEIMRTIRVDYIEPSFLQGIVDWRLRPAFRLLAPNGNWLEYGLGTYIMASPTFSSDTDKVHCEAIGYDFSLILKDDKVTSRHYVAAGSKYTNSAASLINSAGVTRVNIAASDLTLSADMEWEIGTPKLTIVNELLSAINYEPIHFDGNGFACSKAYIESQNRQIEYYYKTDEQSLVCKGTTNSDDLFDIPNVFVRYTDNPDVGKLTSTYVNDNANNILSTVSRGRQIVDVDTVADIANQVTLDSYTRMVAIERSQAYQNIELPTAIMPHHDYRDCLYVGNDSLGIKNRYIEYSWTLPLKIGGTMSHTLRRVISL